MQKTYQVNMYHETSGHALIKAKSQKEAEKRGLKQLEEIGEEAIKEVTHRDYSIL